MSRHHPPVPPEEFEKPDLLRLEKETLGLYVSEHPLSSLRAELRAKTDATIAELERRRDGESVVVGGIISEVKQITTQARRADGLPAPRRRHRRDRVRRVRRRLRRRMRALRRPTGSSCVKGRVDHKEGETKLLAQEISAFESVAAKRTVRLRIDATKAAAGIIGELATLLREFPGESPVFVDCVTSQGPLVLRLGPSFCVEPDPDFYAEVRALLGESALA